MSTLDDSMFVNADTLVALQIMGSECHPNSQMQGPDKSKSAAKKNLSVYGLLKSLASTSQGQTRLLQLLLRPSIDLDVIRERHQAIAAVLQPENSHVKRSIARLIKKALNIKNTLVNLRRGVDLPARIKHVNRSVWMILSKFARAAIGLRESVLLLDNGQDLPLVRKVGNTSTSAVSRLVLSY